MIIFQEKKKSTIKSESKSLGRFECIVLSGWIKDSQVTFRLLTLKLCVSKSYTEGKLKLEAAKPFKMRGLGLGPRLHALYSPRSKSGSQHLSLCNPQANDWPFLIYHSNLWNGQLLPHRTKRVRYITSKGSAWTQQLVRSTYWWLVNGNFYHLRSFLSFRENRAPVAY